MNDDAGLPPVSGSSDERGPFDDLLRPDARPRRPEGNSRLVAIVIGVLAVLLVVLLLPPISILSRGGGNDGSKGPTVKTTARKDMPAPPDGLQAVSPLYDVTVSGHIEGPTTITLQLPSPLSDGRNLSFYTDEKGEWVRLSSASLVADGVAASAELTEMPQNIVVLQRDSSARQLLGNLPAGSEISASAAQSLSVVSPVDFTPDSDGSLSGHATTSSLPTGLPVRPAIRAANSDSVNAVNAIMASPDLRGEHVNAILAMVESGHYDGVNIDYGAIDALRKDDFSDFVNNLAEQLHRRRLVLTLTAPLPVQQGSTWDSGAYDWSRLASLADTIVLAPESDPSHYYDRTEQAVNYLIDDQKVASSKLILQVSPLSVEKGGEGTQSLTALEAMATGSSLSAGKTDGIKPGQAVTVKGDNIDKSNGASGIAWDDGAEAVTFTYSGLGGDRTVWLENAFSIAFKLDLVSRFQLGGVSIADVSNSVGAGDIWPVLQNFFDTGKVSLVKPNGSLLAPHWEADGGSLEGGDKGEVTWVAPDEQGEYHVTLVISDGLARVGQRITLTVQP